MRLLLAMPVDHQLDWPAAAAFVAGLSDEVLERVAPECSAILGQRVVLPAIVLRQRLSDALAELRAAMDGALVPNEQDYRERRVLGHVEVLMEPHPPQRRTFIADFVELMEHVGVLDVLGCASLCSR